ncbi:SRR1-domain-containing protein [Mycena polygramma]|nr:SRR1-domain-containing protein [Mycena polygramma]
MTSDNTFQYSDFKAVVPRKKRKNRVQSELPSLLCRVERAREELAKDDWNAQCQQLLQKHLTTCASSPVAILCLGLGSPSSSPNSRAQLGFLLEICKSTGLEHANVSIYDPVFSEEDNTLFEQLGLRDGKHPLDAPTLLWMPHCDLDLYENVLAANWSREQLAYVILIANRLGDYVEGNPRHKLETRAPCLLRLENVMQSCPLPASSAWTAAFNTIAIQSIDRNAEIPGSWFSESDKLPTATDAHDRSADAQSAELRGTSMIQITPTKRYIHG